MKPDLELCRGMLRKLYNRVILAEQAAEEARQICHEMQELLFDIEESECPIRMALFKKVVGG
jgi:hypothetical protein